MPIHPLVFLIRIIILGLKQMKNYGLSEVVIGWFGSDVLGPGFRDPSMSYHISYGFSPLANDTKQLELQTAWVKGEFNPHTTSAVI